MLSGIEQFGALHSLPIPVSAACHSLPSRQSLCCAKRHIAAPERGFSDMEMCVLTAVDDFVAEETVYFQTAAG